MMVANDGFSAGHVVRTVAIAKALVRRSARRKMDLRVLLVTTSEADALLQEPELAVVRLPAPVKARGANFSDDERRRILRGAIDGVLASYAPDLLVVDTFPSGPHDELAGITTDAKRALVRRHVPLDKAFDIRRGLESYDLAIIAADPTAVDVTLPIRTLHVPPITLHEESLPREEARTRLGLAHDRRIALVTSGGGGDAQATEHAREIAHALARIEPTLGVVLALGPLDRSRENALRVAPLQPYLQAFDVVFSPAGYNTAHELAKAEVPAVLWPEPRPFDDQGMRMARFVGRGQAIALESFDDRAIAAVLARASDLRPLGIEKGGADRAADALLDLATGGRT